MVRHNKHSIMLVKLTDLLHVLQVTLANITHEKQKIKNKT